MSKALIEKIEERIDRCTEQLAADIIRLVNIKSVVSDPLPDAPFGKGVREVFEVFTEMARSLGLHCRDYGVGVVSASVKQGQPDLGIWLHGDVVPEGEGWRFPPYDATEYRGCIIGRGATDNKGQLAAILNLFKILSELGIELRYNPAIYVGGCEERSMRDLLGDEEIPEAKGFLNVCAPPRLSLVPDGSFPLGYGGKGAIILTLQSKTPLRSCRLTAGQDSAPGCATAIFDTVNLPDTVADCTVRKGKYTEIEAFSPPRHASNPDPKGNMITKLSTALLDADLVAAEDRYIFEFLKKVSCDATGELFRIDTNHDTMGRLTVFSQKIDCVEGYPRLTLNIRYPLGITGEEITERITHYAKEEGFFVTDVKKPHLPYLLDPNTEIVRALCDAANEVEGRERAPYTTSGATYAHHLPCAYVFGMSGNCPPDDFPAGRGGAHGIDEAVSLNRLKKAMKIYARALLKLNSMDW